MGASGFMMVSHARGTSTPRMAFLLTFLEVVLGPSVATSLFLLQVSFDKEDDDRKERAGPTHQMVATPCFWEVSTIEEGESIHLFRGGERTVVVGGKELTFVAIKHLVG